MGVHLSLNTNDKDDFRKKFTKTFELCFTQYTTIDIKG